ncbi:hypothetical protein [Calidithermus roseus]|uniref:Uncharacterized protein n=1 Tax=Calidithermus roseus TaxID=1644118 RepID=A0A399ETS4_9DEIN|nr:hypothetical protein [Calidithermus roseus]RIH87378.1 hypothetical protein Mrose_01357 [Calidithermus roseus]
MSFEFHTAFAISQQKFEAYRREAEIARSIRAARAHVGFRSHIARVFRQMADRIEPKAPAPVR